MSWYIEGADYHIPAGETVSTRVVVPAEARQITVYAPRALTGRVSVGVLERVMEDLAMLRPAIALAAGECTSFPQSGYVQVGVVSSVVETDERSGRITWTREGA